MHLWLLFWRSTILWTGSIALLVTVNRLYIHFTGDYYHGPGAVLLVLGGIPNAIAWFLPLTVFAGGIAAASTWDSIEARSYRFAALRVGLLLVFVALLIFLSLAYLSPWLESRAMNSLLTAAEQEPMVPVVRPVLYEHYVHFLNEAEKMPRPVESPAQGLSEWGIAYGLGWQYHMQVTAAVLGAIMAALGMLVGRWTAFPLPRLTATLQRLAIAVVLLAAIYVTTHQGGRLSTELHVPPALTAYAVLLIPAAVLLTLSWVSVVAPRETRLGSPGVRRT